MTRILIAGSRTATEEDYEKLKKAWAAHQAKHNPQGDAATIVHGGAAGADQHAERLGRETGTPTEIYRPEWKKYGKAAGMRRNAEMVNDADSAIILWNKTSKGTAMTLRTAQRKGKPITLILI